MQVLVACDKFKGSISAVELCETVVAVITDLNPSANCISQPMADGGDGTLSILKDFLELEQVTVDTIDPLGRSIRANYLSSDQVAYIELAEASGMVHLDKSELDILSTTTVGTGILIKHALDHGHTQIVLSLGGSCTNDMGIGIASILGYSFYDSSGSLLKPNGGNLIEIQKVEEPLNLPNFKLTILCDVENPLYGPNGAAHIYGPQKGATPQIIELLDEGMKHLSSIIKSKWNKSISDIIGGGSAGGISAGLLGLFPDVNLQKGFDYLSNLVKLEEKISGSDLIISGEGQLDKQSFQGKVVGNIYKLAQKHHVPIAIIVGKNDLDRNLNAKVYEVLSEAKSIDDSFKNTEKYIKLISQKIYSDLIQSDGLS